MAKAKTTKQMFGRGARSGLEEQAASITPDLTYQTEAQKKAVQSRSDQLQQGIARRAGLEGSGLRTGMSGQNIRLMGTIGAQQLAEESAIEQRAGGEQRANLQALLGAQSMEDQRTLRERQFGLQGEQFEEGKRQFGVGERERTRQFTEGKRQFDVGTGERTRQFGEGQRQFNVGTGEGIRQFDVGTGERTRQFEEGRRQFGVGETERTRQFDEAKRQFERQQNLRAQESVQQFGLQKRAATEAETAGAAQRKAVIENQKQAMAQLTGVLQGESVDPNEIFTAFGIDSSRGVTSSDWGQIIDAGFRYDEATGKFIRETETLAKTGQESQIDLSGRQVTEAEKAGESARRLSEAQLTGELEDEEGGTTDTLAKRQQDLADQQAQGQIELAERQRQDARDLRFEELGLQSADLTERARQFDADLAEKSAQFQDSYGLSADQFLESKRQFDSGIAMEDQRVANQMNQFNAEQKLRAAELFGGEGISKLELANSYGTKEGDSAYRRDLDFNQDGKIDNQDEDTFDSLAEDGVIRGRGTLAQRQQEYQEARFETEADLQSEALQIDRDKIKSVFDAQKNQLDFTMAQFNTAFTGQLFEAGPDGSIMVMDADGNPLTSTQEKVARNNLERLEDAMDDSLLSIAMDMGLVGGDSGKDSIGDLSDEKMFSLVSLMMANRAPASTAVGYSGRFNQEQPSGWMQALGILGQTAGSVFQGKFG